MQETYCTSAIVLKRQAFRENDSWVVLYSESKGRLELVARGTRKFSSKMSAHLEPFNLSRIMVVRGRALDYIGSVSSENCFISIKSDFSKITVAGQAIKQFLGMVKPDEKDESLFNLLKRFLSLLNELEYDSSTAYKMQILYYSFIFKLLGLLGYGPELIHCVSCRKKVGPTGNSFCGSLGGIICPSCQKTIKYDNIIDISENGIKILRLMAGNPIDDSIRIKAGTALLSEIRGIVGSFNETISCY